MAHVERLRLYPVKSLDATEVETARVADDGTLAGDRRYAMCPPDAGPIATREDVARHAINGVETDRVHDVRTRFDPDTEVLTVDPIDGGRLEPREFDLESDRDAASEWLGEFVGRDLVLRRADGSSFVDRPDAGPSVVSTATLETVASWFDDVTVESARRRLRANVEIDGVPAFWEDRFVGEDAPAFVVDGVRFEGVEPCARCVVPQRDPDTGERTPEFRERLIGRRKATFPDWADPDAFDHYYTVMLIAGIPEGSRGRTISVGDDVDVVD